MTDEQFAEWDRIWRAFQEDLANRSTHGSFGSLKRVDISSSAISPSLLFRRSATSAEVTNPRAQWPRRPPSDSVCKGLCRSSSIHQRCQRADRRRDGGPQRLRKKGLNL